MLDHDLRKLRRAAIQGDDPEAATKLTRILKGGTCEHRVRSWRIWTLSGKVRRDHFCLSCGLNMTHQVQDGTRPTMEDCDPSISRLRQDREDEAARRAADQEEHEAMLREEEAGQSLMEYYLTPEDDQDD